MSFPLKSMVLLCGLLACGAVSAAETACRRFQQQYAGQYTEINCVDKDTAVVRNRQDEWAVADSQNRLLVPFGTYYLIDWTDHIFLLGQNDKLLLRVGSPDEQWGVIDRNGKQILPPDYDVIELPKQSGDPIVLVTGSSENRRYGLADQAGNILLEPRYPFIGNFSEGLAAYTADPVIKDGKENPHARFGFLDRQGKTVIAPQFSYFNRKPFGDGVAWVKRADSSDWLLIDRTGKTLLRMSNIYQEVFNFDENGLALVLQNGLTGLINKRGESVLAAYNHITWLHFKPFYLLEKGGKSGAADIRGKAVIPPRFDYMTEWENGKTPQGQIAFVRGANAYLFDQNGRQLARRLVRHTKQCAHITLGLPHKSKTGYRVSQVFTDRNEVWFSYSGKDIGFVNSESGTCSDVAAPRKKRRS